MRRVQKRGVSSRTRPTCMEINTRNTKHETPNTKRKEPPFNGGSMQRRMSRREWLRFGAAGALGAGLYKGLAAFGPEKLRAEDQPVLDVSEMGGIREPLGNYIYLTPTKLGGSTHAVDLHRMKQLAFISYWNYGD